MARVTQAHLDARRQQIIDAAYACFTRSGFHQTTMQEICREAQLSAGAVYRYFSGKDEIIEAICAEGLQRSLDFIAETEHGDTLAVTNALVDRFFSQFEGPDVTACSLDVELWAEALRNPKAHAILSHAFSAVRDRFAGLIRESQAEGEFNPHLSAEAIAQVAISLFQGLLLQKLLDPGLEVETYAAVVKALLGGSFWQGRR